MVRTVNEQPNNDRQVNTEVHTQTERQYWSSLLNGRMMPGLGLAASRVKNTPAQPNPLPKVTGRLTMPADDPSAISPSR